MAQNLRNQTVKDGEGNMHDAPLFMFVLAARYDTNICPWNHGLQAVP